MQPEYNTIVTLQPKSPFMFQLIDHNMAAANAGLRSHRLSVCANGSDPQEMAPFEVTHFPATGRVGE